MNRELDILSLADYYEKFEYKNSSAYLIINKKMKDYQAMFGFVTLDNDISQARHLFCQMEKKAKQLGHDVLIGPVNYTTWMSYRWAISNFSLQLFPDCNNPPYYNTLVHLLGYKELYTYRSASIDIYNPLFKMGEQIYSQKCKEGYRFDFFDQNSALKVAREVYDISIDAFSDSALYSPIPYDVFETLYLSWIKQLQFSLIIAYSQNNPVGYVFGYDNPLADTFISKTSAVLKSHQKQKVYIALLYLGAKWVANKGYKNMVYHFQCEQKDSFKRFEKHLESNEKRYAVYYKEL